MPDVYVDSFVMTVQKNKVEDYQKFGEGWLRQPRSMARWNT